VLVGDAFATSCPAAGTGTGKVFTDVERLSNAHIPQWFASAGMGMDKISSFYHDPIKQACDAHSLAKAYSLRSLSLDTGLRPGLGRAARFAMRLAVGVTRRTRGRLRTSVKPMTPHPAAAEPIAARKRQPSPSRLG
jgi:2-polyprenyl-6-methoxyphenol hydroxylase-like FAD-dependent oxidoreductase